MIEVELALHRTRKSLWQVCNELGINHDECKIVSLDTCSSCGIWLKTTRLIPDLDGNPICNECYTHYGL